MYVRIPTNSQDKNDAIDYYEGLGMQLDEVIKHDRESITLVFYCDKDLGASAVQNIPGSSAELRFEDGSSSPLYIRRGPSND